MADTKPQPPRDGEIKEPVSDRRGMLATSAVLAGSVCALAPLGAAAVFVLDPILRKRAGDATDDGFVKVATLDMLPADGSPIPVPVIADRRDAWNLERNAELGTVYLRQVGEAIVCFSAKCPHLGCFVQQRGEGFHCPCHDSQFQLDGSRTNDTPPRGLDTLEVRVDENDILVKYQTFRTGIHEKIPV